MNTKTHYSLYEHNTFHFDVCADTFVEYDSVEELCRYIQLNRSYINSHSPLLHIGEGSNLLFLHDFKGVVLHSCIKTIQRLSERKNVIVLRVGSGMKWDDFVAYCTINGFCGLENLSGIPGEVGASAVQNIGAYGVEAADYIFRVEAVDLQTGKKRIFLKKDCQYAYRSSIFKTKYKGRYAITHVHYKLNKRFIPQLEYKALKSVLAGKYSMRKLTASDIRKEVIHLRDSKLPDPKIYGNAGSFFMNPVVAKEKYQDLCKKYELVPFYPIDESTVKIPAAWLIEKCGWKGKKSGTVGVYENQPLVLVHYGEGTGRDVVNLAEEIKGSVLREFGIELVPEVNYIE